MKNFLNVLWNIGLNIMINALLFTLFYQVIMDENLDYLLISAICSLFLTMLFKWLLSISLSDLDVKWSNNVDIFSITVSTCVMYSLVYFVPSIGLQ